MSAGFGVREERCWIVALPLTSCVTLGKSLTLSEPHFPHLKNASCAGPPWELDEIMYVKL